MAGRIRNTKKLAQRIDRDYFKRLYPIPRWRRILSLAFAVAGLAWVAWSSVGGGGKVFNAGPLSRKHHLLEAKCDTCHSGPAAFGSQVTDQSCTTCHDGPQHQAQQVTTPACVSCHVEHRGAFALAAVNDATCTGCHADLQTKDGTHNVAMQVTSFTADHPDFRNERGDLKDTGTIKFGHQVHMKPDLRGPNGPEQLQCTGCHTLQPDGRMSGAKRADHCDRCHRLEFYRNITDVLPHDKPEVALAFARQSFADYIASHPGDVNRVDPPLDPRILSPRPAPAGSAAEWIRRRMEETQLLMARKTCVECHTPVMAGGAIQSIPAANTRTDWMTRAKFDHKPHQLVDCASCHTTAAESKETADVLLPGIATCRSCHHTGASGADASCAECHVYHDWSKAKPVDPQFKIEQFLR